MKRFLVIFSTVSIFIAIVFIIGLKQYNKLVPDAGMKDFDFEYTAEEFAAKLEIMDDGAIMDEFGGKIILINGQIDDVFPNNDTYDVLISTGDPMVGINVNLVQEMSEKAKSLQVGQDVSVQGFFSGKLIDIELSRGVIVE